MQSPQLALVELGTEEHDSIALLTGDEAPRPRVFKEVTALLKKRVTDSSVLYSFVVIQFSFNSVIYRFFSYLLLIFLARGGNVSLF